MKRSFTGSVIINKPQAEIFNFMTDLSKLPLWTNISEIKITSEGPTGVGTTYIETYEANGKISEIQSEITGFEPYSKWSYKTSSKPFSLKVSYSLTPLEEGVKIEGMGEMNLGLFSFSLPTHLVVVPMIKNRLENSLKTLKNVLEPQASTLPSAEELPEAQ